MLQCIKTEIKTLFSMKSLLICFLLMIAMPMYFIFSQYSNTAKSFEARNASIEETVENFSDEEQEEFNTWTAEEDETFITQKATIYEALSPQMGINNAFATLLGFGTIIFPMLAALFIGNEHSSFRTIKAKITYCSLPKVVVSKLLALIIGLLGFFVVYSLVSLTLVHFSWNYFLVDYFKDSIYESDVTVSYLKIFGVTIFVLMFYAIISFFISFVSKSSIMGIIAAFCFTFISFPTKYDHNNMFSNLFIKTFFTNGESGISFPEPALDSLSAESSFIILFLIALVFVAATVVVSRRQRN